MESDMTRKAMLKAVNRLQQAADLLAKKVPFGPDRIQLTPAELRRSWSRTTQDNRSKLLEELGWEQLINSLTGGRQIAR